MGLVACLRAGLGSTASSRRSAVQANAIRSKVPISNRTKLASRRQLDAPPPPPFDDEPQSFPPRQEQQKASTDSDGVFFLGMVLLTTILFTREWIGDAVPILVVPIAALAFTPLGGYVAGKVNEQQQTSSQRYRPSQEYQQRDDPDRNYNEWQDMRDRSQADFDEPDSVSRAARTANNPDESDWGASMSNPVLSQQQQQTSDEQEWGESSSVPLYSTTAAEPRRDAVDSLQQGADGRRQPQEAQERSPLRHVGPSNFAGLTSAAFTAPFVEHAQSHRADAASTGTPGQSTKSTDRRTQTDPHKFSPASGQQKQREDQIEFQSWEQGNHQQREAEQPAQPSNPMDEMAAVVAEAADAATAAAQAALTATDTAAGEKATRAARAAADAAAAAAASPAAAAASTFAAVSSAATATAQSAAAAAGSAHQHLSEVFSDTTSYANGSDKATTASKASSPVATAHRSTSQRKREAATVAEYTDVKQAAASLAVESPQSDTQQSVPTHPTTSSSTEHGTAQITAQAPLNQSQSTSAVIPGGRDQQRDIRQGEKHRSSIEGAVQVAASPTTQSSAENMHAGGQQVEPEVVEAVEVLMPDDYEYLQRQRQRLQRRRQDPRARQGSSWGAQQRRNAPEYGAEPREGQPAWWAGATQEPSGYSSVNEPYVRSQQGGSRRARYTEEVGQRSQRRRSTSQGVSARASTSGGAQGWDIDVVASRAPRGTSRRMNARDLAAAHEHGRMSRFDSWSGGLSTMGPVGGLVKWMFGARARARVRDTVSASRRPVMGALMRVFPFLRSWGGLM